MVTARLMNSRSDQKKLSLLDTVRDRLSKMPVIYDLWLTLRCINVKGYIFVASTGRSGTQSLSRIFAAAQKAICVHEPPPVMLRRCPQGMDEAQYFRELFHQKKETHDPAPRQIAPLLSRDQPPIRQNLCRFGHRVF
jgi:hypothetical protein